MSVVQGTIRSAQTAGRTASMASMVVPSLPAHHLNVNSIMSMPPLETRERDDKSLLLAKSVKLLWRCELLLMVEFFESVVPFVYAAYIVMLYQLPNAKYYPAIHELLQNPNKQAAYRAREDPRVRDASAGVAAARARDPQAQVQTLGLPPAGGRVRERAARRPGHAHRVANHHLPVCPRAPRYVLLHSMSSVVLQKSNTSWGPFGGASMDFSSVHFTWIYDDA